MTIDLKGLNDRQTEAVLHDEGPCLVLAGAGSGKTRVLTVRAARLIDEGVRPERILLATFTKKAAEEMRKRLSVVVGEDLAKAVWIGTFHSHCLRILKITCAELGYRPFEILPPGKAVRLARDILAEPDDKHPYGMNWATDPKLALSRVSRAKADLVDLFTAERYFREHMDLGDNLDNQIEFWRRYEQAKSDKDLLDFDDLLMRTYNILSTNEAALSRWQQAFDFILEDEVQDTMIAQHEIVKLLAARHRNYFCVGDVNQSCYGFRGSDPDHTVMSFRRDYPEGSIIKMPVNYRSQAEIVTCGARLIRHNAVSSAYTLDPESNRGAGGSPILFVPVSEDDEADQIAKMVLDKVLEGHSYRDIAALYRVNAQSRALEDAMVRHNVPYVVYGTCGFYDRHEIKDALAYLQLAHNPNCEAGDDALSRVINIPTKWFRMGFEKKTTHFLGKKFIAELETLARRNRCSMYEALDLGNWIRWQGDSIADFKDFVESVRSAGDAPSAMLHEARETGYDAHLAREQGAEDNDNDGTLFDNLDELVYAASKYANACAFLDFVTQQRSRAKGLGKDQDAVQLLTLHRSKGLEWPVVYLCGVSLGLLPHRRSVEYYDPEYKQHIIPQSIEEERRLCYVGVTRAMDELYISALLQYQEADLRVSPFISDMGFETPVQFLHKDKSGQMELTRWHENE
jgi:DNA helicase-2/ATP-dependent DNA helicase PcrA